MILCWLSSTFTPSAVCPRVFSHVGRTLAERFLASMAAWAKASPPLSGSGNGNSTHFCAILMPGATRRPESSPRHHFQRNSGWMPTGSLPQFGPDQPAIRHYAAPGNRRAQRSRKAATLGAGAACSTSHSGVSMTSGWGSSRSLRAPSLTGGIGRLRHHRSARRAVGSVRDC